MKVVSPSFNGQLIVSSSMMRTAALSVLLLSTRMNFPSGAVTWIFAPQFMRAIFFASLLSSDSGGFALAQFAPRTKAAMPSNAM